MQGYLGYEAYACCGNKRVKEILGKKRIIGDELIGKRELKSKVG